MTTPTASDIAAERPADAPTQGQADAQAKADTEHAPLTFGLKDIFTCVNILGAVASIIFCIEGELRYAAYAFLGGYILGDSLDGLVARLTNTANRFGAEFDIIGDHFAQCIVPAFMVYVAYRPISPYLAAALAATLVISGSVRHARGAVASPNFPSAYFGMPRTVSAILVISYINSAFAPHIPGWQWMGIPLVLFVSLANLLPIPFRTHRGRKLKHWVKYFIGGFFVTTIAAAIILPAYVFDVTFVWLLAYSVGGWTELDPDERREFFARAREWSARVRAAR